MSNRSLVTVTLPDGSSAAQLWTWSDVGTVDWVEFFQPLADLLAGVEGAVWTATPVPDDVSDRTAMTGH